MKRFFKKYYGYFLAFLIPIIILFFIFAIKSVFLGHGTILYGDMQAQYLPFLSFWQDVLLEGKSIFYSFSNSIGGEVFSTITYYLTSPFNLLVVFFDKLNLLDFLYLIVFFKLALASLTMYFYIDKTFLKLHNNYKLLFSLCYGLMAFNISYYFNIIWLDAIYLLPLVMHQIDNLINDRKFVWYGIFLFLAIVSNYYMGYMICLFSVIYFIYRLFNKYNWQKDRKTIIDRLLIFGFASLFSGLMTCFILIPTYFSVSNSRMNYAQMENYIGFIDIIGTFSKLFIGSNDENITTLNGAYLYASILVFVLVLLYFLNSKTKKKEKRLSLVVLFIFFLSITCGIFYCIWNAFSFPIGLHFRFSYLIVFFLIFLAIRSFLNLPKEKKPYIYASLIYGIICFLYLFTDYSYLNYFNILTSFVLFCLYALILYIINNYKHRKILLQFLLLLLVATELFFNGFICIRRYDLSLREEYIDFLELNTKIKEVLPEDEFYRFESTDPYSANDSFLYNYNGLNAFNSNYSKVKNVMLLNAGFKMGNNFVTFDSSNIPVVPSLLGLKYHASKYDKKYYNKIETYQVSRFSGLLYGFMYDDFYLYENPYASDIMFLVDDNVLDFNKLINSKKYNMFEYQNLLLNTMLGYDDDVLIKQDVKKIDDNNYQITLNTDDDIYIKSNIELDVKNPVKLYINDELLGLYDYEDLEYSSNYIVIDNYQKGDVLNFRYEITGKSKITDLPDVYGFDYEKFKQIMNTLNSSDVEVTSFSETSIKATVDVSDKTVLFTSIPYEEGWHAYVDSKEVDIVRLYDSMNGLILTEGTHDIEFVFKKPGLNIGIIVSIISFISFIIYYFYYEKINKFFVDLYMKYEEIILYLIVGFLTTVVNVVVYAILAKTIGLHYMISTIFAWIAAVIFAYVANKQIVFKSKKNNKKELIKEAYEFFKFRIISLGMEVILMYVLVSLLAFNDIISKIFVNVVVIIANYIFSKLFIFKKSD